MRLLSVLFIILCIRAFSKPVQAQAARKVTLIVGQTQQLHRANAAWSSGKPKIAAVSPDGRVNALKKGKTTITAKVGKKKYTYRITVQAPRLSASVKKLALKKSFTLKVKNTNRKFRITSSDPSIAKIRKTGTNRVKITANNNGTAQIRAAYKGVTLSCSITCGTGSDAAAGPSGQTAGAYTLSYKENVILSLSGVRSAIAQSVSSAGSFGQSAPLYTSIAGGDGLENIYAPVNNGNVCVPGVTLSEEARTATINKACAWASAVCSSPFHGYDRGSSDEKASWGIPKANAPGTGDYCCFTLAECAYYFAGVNLLGESLGNLSAVKYPPFSELLFDHGSVSFYGDDSFGPTATAPFTGGSRDHVKNLYTHVGFELVKTVQSGKLPDSFPLQAGDIVVSTRNGAHHEQLIIESGTTSHCKVAEACGEGGGGALGGDQSGNELMIYSSLYKPSDVLYVFRFRGTGVVLNTAGLTG